VVGTILVANTAASIVMSMTIGIIIRRLVKLEREHRRTNEPT
jgi:hypothetical protein